MERAVCQIPVRRHPGQVGPTDLCDHRTPNLEDLDMPQAGGTRGSVSVQGDDVGHFPNRPSLGPPPLCG